MKTITTITTKFSLGSCRGEEPAILTDYVSDDYDVDCSEWNEPIFHEGVNYTKTLRDFYSRVDSLGDELEGAWSELEDFSTQITADATLSKKDREALSNALEDVSHELYGLSEERFDALTALKNALDAFRNLILTD